MELIDMCENSSFHNSYNRNWQLSAIEIANDNSFAYQRYLRLRSAHFANSSHALPCTLCSAIDAKTKNPLFSARNKTTNWHRNAHLNSQNENIIRSWSKRWNAKRRDAKKKVRKEEEPMVHFLSSPRRRHFYLSSPDRSESECERDRAWTPEYAEHYIKINKIVSE